MGKYEQSKFVTEKMKLFFCWVCFRNLT